MESFALFLTIFLAQAPEPVSEAEAEERLRAKLPYDCLGGVCLNAQASSIPEKVVQVVGHNFRRRTTTCKGRVVEIRVITSWTSHGSSERAIPGANTILYMVENHSGVSSFYDIRQLLEEGLDKMGWSTWKSQDRLRSPKVQGDRLIETWDHLNTGDTTLSLVSEHPYKDDLCAYQKVQGL